MTASALRHPRWVRVALWGGVLGVVTYVAGWLFGGVVHHDYDPLTQAISELFALGAPWASRGPLLVGLLLSGLAMVALAPAFHHALPGRGRLGPLLVAVAGLGTLTVAVAPCTAGCPGTDTGGTDAAHTLAAGVGYLALVCAPLAFGWRLRHAMPGLSRWSYTLGFLALAGMVVRYLGVVEVAPGLQQRIFNTIADLWYLLVAVVLLREERRPGMATYALGNERVNARHHPRTGDG